VLLIVPFLRFGEWMTGSPNLPLAPVALKDIIFGTPGAILRGVGLAILGWLACLLPSYVGIFYATKFPFAFLQKR
jgi:hypothetical protein